MNRFLLLATPSAAMTALVTSGVALAASAATGAKTQSGQQIVDAAEPTVRQIEADARSDAILKQAKGVFIMLDVVKRAFIDGADVMQDISRDHSYYGKPVDAQQILGGQASNAAADRLVAALPG